MNKSMNFLKLFVIILFLFGCKHTSDFRKSFHSCGSLVNSHKFYSKGFTLFVSLKAKKYFNKAYSYIDKEFKKSGVVTPKIKIISKKNYSCLNEKKNEVCFVGSKHFAFYQLGLASINFKTKWILKKIKDIT